MYYDSIGSGKTLAFVIPLLQKLKANESQAGVRGIILSPTRELAQQTLKVTKDLSKFLDLRIISIVGGDSIDSQFDSLSNRPDVIIATPGRLMHHLSEISTFKLKSVQYIVFDEADRLFEMGFAEQINEIIKQCPIERQTLLFSATMPKALMQFTRAGLRDPQLIRLDTDVKMSEELRLGFFYIRSNEKIAALLYIVRQILPSDQLTIIFTATRHHSEFLFNLLQHIGLKCTLIYGSMDQESRSTNLKSFRMGEVNYLIVTDLAARGIDIPLINNVINFHFPSTPKLFVHRCGRAARQGRIGFGFSLVEPDELPYAVDVFRFLDISISNGIVNASSNDVSDPLDDERSILQDSTGGTILTYTLQTMIPSYVHIGLLPQDILDEELDYVKSALSDHEHLSTSFKVSENGMKQYRRTRTAASNDGVKTCKRLIKENYIKYLHPLIQGCDPKRCSSNIIEKANFIRMLQTFRPQQTVLETGIGTGCANGSNKNIKKSKLGTKESHGVDVMKSLRKLNNDHLERNRKKLSIIPDTDDGGVNNENQSTTFGNIIEATNLNSLNNDEIVLDVSCADEFDDALELEIHHDKAQIYETVKEANQYDIKPRLSIAEKKKLKKRGYSKDQIDEYLSQKALLKLSSLDENSDENNEDDSTKFRDKRFYMTYGTEDERATYAEETLQPKSSLKSSETNSELMTEFNVLIILIMTI